MLIEFIGLPGSGKTTFEKTLIQDSDVESILNRQGLDEMKISFKNLWAYFFKNWKLVGLFMVGTLWNFEINLKRWYALIIGVKTTLVQYAKIDFEIKKNPDLKIIMDEGLLQRINSVYGFHRRILNFFLMQKHLELIKGLGVIDKVYYLKVSTSVSIDRCKIRSTGLPYRYLNFDKEQLISKFNYAQLGLEKIRFNFPDEMIEIENE